MKNEFRGGELLKQANSKRISRRDFLRITGTGLAGATILGTAGCGLRGVGSGGGSGGEEEYTIRFSHVVAKGDPKGLAVERFKEVLEENTDGRIVVEHFPNSELYGDADEMQAIQTGSVEMLAPSSSKFTTIAPQLQILDLPFMFNGPEDISEVVSRDTPVGQSIFENEELAQTNIRVISLWDDGFKQLTANTEVRGPDDLNGLRMRVQPADVLRTQFEMWGANPVQVDFAELYTALEQGVADGNENTLTAIRSARMYEVQDYITITNHGYIGYPVVINNEFFTLLPEDLQEAVIEAIDEAAAYNREIAAETNQQALEEIREAETSTIIELSGEEQQAFREPVVPEVWDMYAGVVGEDLVDYLKSREGLS
jgi:C4-dicarboxylate-binding protein DctP